RRALTSAQTAGPSRRGARLLLRHALTRGGQHPPHVVDALASDGARRRVAGEVVQRPAVQRHLRRAVDARDGGELARDALRIRHVAVGRYRRPVLGALALARADAGALRVAVEHVDGHAVAVDDDLAERALGD